MQPSRNGAVQTEPARGSLGEHRAALCEHLDDEERHLLPLIQEHLTVTEWNRLGERFATETPKDKLLFFLGALLEEANDQERAALLDNLPLPARLIWYAIGRRGYIRRMARVRALLPDAVPPSRR